MKRFSIILIILLFTGFCSFELAHKSQKVVFKMLNPTTFEIDLNNNGTIDTGEIVCIENYTSFSTDLKSDNKLFEKSLGLNHEEVIKLGYLAEIFAENIVDRPVKVKVTKRTPDCTYAKISFENKDYAKSLVENGFALKNLVPVNKEKYKEKLEQARKLKLSVLNHKSNKYHKLDCKYGSLAHDAVILPTKQLPKDAIPCKFCHTKHIKAHKKDTSYPLTITKGKIELILTDFTKILKPNSSCGQIQCKEIVKGINNATSSIDIAFYGWDYIPEVDKALLNAKNRGVLIRMVFDDGDLKSYKAVERLLGLYKATSDGVSTQRNIIMHNKFMVFDGIKVITGSMNFTETGLSGFNSNNILVLNSPEIAAFYHNEFEQMFSGKFHNDKSSQGYNEVIIGDSKISTYFSPQDKIITRYILPLIDSAQDYVYMPVFLITHNGLTNALISAKKRGIDVRVIMDATNAIANTSKLKTLRDGGVLVKVENYAGKMHSKTIIIDDKYLVLGSMNYSSSGETKNDENSLIIQDSTFAKYYRDYFDYIWKKIPDRYLKHTIRAESIYSIGSCSDGIDNNFDGKIDKDDIGCQPQKR